MLLLSKGSPIFNNLAVSKLKLPDVLTRLSNGVFTGYASFVFQSSMAILVFDAGKLVSAVVEGHNGTRKSGVEAISALVELMVTTRNGSLNVYKLSKDITMSIHAILEGEAHYKSQELNQVDITSLFGKGNEDQINDCQRMYADGHSGMIVYKDGTLGFFHDGLRALGAASSTKSTDKLIKASLIEVSTIQNIWDTCVTLHKAAGDTTDLERKECDGNAVALKRAELEEQVKSIVCEYVGKVGRNIVDKELSDNGGNMCLVDVNRAEKFMKNIERSAKLLVSGTHIKLMMEKLSSTISNARSEV